jgi:hypothetical protein
MWMELDFASLHVVEIERFDKYIEGLSFGKMLVGIKHQQYLVVSFLQRFHRDGDISEEWFPGIQMDCA